MGSAPSSSGSDAGQLVGLDAGLSPASEESNNHKLRTPELKQEGTKNKTQSIFSATRRPPGMGLTTVQKEFKNPHI